MTANEMANDSGFKSFCGLWQKNGVFDGQFIDWFMDFENAECNYYSDILKFLANNHTINFTTLVPFGKEVTTPLFPLSAYKTLNQPPAVDYPYRWYMTHYRFRYPGPDNPEPVMTFRTDLDRDDLPTELCLNTYISYEDFKDLLSMFAPGSREEARLEFERKSNKESPWFQSLYNVTNFLGGFVYFNKFENAIAFLLRLWLLSKQSIPVKCTTDTGPKTSISIIRRII